MRRSLILTLLLLVLAAGSLGYIHSSLDASKDAVVIEETVLYGDKAAASGIAVNLSAHCDYRLFWDTRYLVGENPEINTSFAFSQAQQRTQTRAPFSIYVDTAFGGGFGASGILDMKDETLPIQAVASRTLPGQKRTETVYIKDYYHFYPLEVSLDRRVGFAINEEMQQVFADYFRIPVYPEHRVEISIEKNAAGSVYGIGMSPVGEGMAHFKTATAVTDDGCFFIVTARTTEGELLDTSHVPGGYGIYHFPLHDQEGDDRILTADELQTVYALDAERVGVVTLQTSQDKSKLLLVTIEDGTYMLTVIDAATAKELQKLELLPVGEDLSSRSTGFRQLYAYEHFIVPILSDGRFALLALDVGGSYQVQFTGDLRANEQTKDIFRYGLVMDYNGQELAIAAFQEPHYQISIRNNCSFHLAVYDPLGVAYIGHYQHSLDRSIVEQHRLTCLPLDDTPLTVTWGN